MRLVWFTLGGYKRFMESTKINVDGKLVAIVGPNEAGKTSILQAIERLKYFGSNTYKSLKKQGVEHDITRGYDPKEDEKILTWQFFLTNEDKEQFQEIPNAGEVKWLKITETVSGKFELCLIPNKLKRDISLRNQLAKIIKKLPEKTNSWHFKKSMLNVLESDEQNLILSHINALKQSQVFLNQMIKKNELESDLLVNELSKVIDNEEKEHPKERVINILKNRIPKIIFFSNSDRDLPSNYNLNSFFQQKSPQSVPAALKNLAIAGKFDLKEIYNARQKNNIGLYEDILEKATNNLNQLIQNNWSQSKISIKLSFDSLILTVCVKSKEGAYAPIAERSDGLRQFVAMLLFLSKQLETQKSSNIKPIILIDEIETHLHYDAQADIVQMFARQNLASQIIYTTHSIGCLPEDLGSGVRLVEMVEAHSQIINSFWDNNEGGFSKLLFGMGASTLAFIPIRYTVIAEGAVDMLLLPALLKEYLKKDELGFMVAQGLSNMSENQFALIDNQAPRVAYLVDDDDGGRDIKRKIKSANISEERIITLPRKNQKDTVIEDYINAESYVVAVNQELSLSHGNEYKIKIDDIKGAKRPNHLEKWCKERQINNTPKKVKVAYKLLENKYALPLVEPGIEPLLQKLFEDIKSALKLPLESN